MALKTRGGPEVTVGEDVEDLRAWLQRLQDGPEVTETVVLTCPDDRHGEDRPTWFFVEADAAAGLARRRCVACAAERSLLDSAELWTFPPMHACLGCGQSMMELALGLHTERREEGEGGIVTWIALGARCVACGRIAGLTDVQTPPVDVESLLQQV